MENKKLEKIKKILDDKKATFINVIETKEKTTLADYFILANGTSSTHIKALADNVEQDLKKENIFPYKIEGYASGNWILMDYEDILVNIFTPDAREQYNLDDLWEKARS